MWSLTSPRIKLIGRFRKFRSYPSKNFFDSIGQVRKPNPILRVPGCPVAYAGYGLDVCKYERFFTYRKRSGRDALRVVALEEH
jgi:hypothetical protein